MWTLLPIWLMLPLAVLVGAFGNRLRGGLWNNLWHRGDTTARIVFWGFPCSVLAHLSGAGPICSTALLIALWLGCTFPTNHAIDMGHNEGTFIGDFFGISLYGVTRVLPACGVLAGFHFSWLPLLLAGGSACLWYSLAWLWPLPINGFGLTTGGYDPPCSAEATHGAAMATGLVLSLSGFLPILVPPHLF